MSTSIFPENLLVLDIETVSLAVHYDDLEPEWKLLWKQKMKFWTDKLPEQDEEALLPELYREKAAIYAEFGKIVCISCGVFTREADSWKLKVKTLSHANERQLLEQFTTLVEYQYKKSRQMVFCGHNIREFDIPYLCRRMLVNGMTIPGVMNFQAAKPWEVPLLDTLQLWKFGDVKHFSSLHLLATLFNIPTSKDDMDGAMVGKVYWEEQDLERIARYCAKDVVTTAQLLLRFKGMALLDAADIIFVG